jgi:cellulose synthase/poly-beta-1,6-N-acetylglucosamine synthase-like glycosyltransferase
MAFEIIFWISVILIFHTYLFYPLLLKVLSYSRKDNTRVYGMKDNLPFVSVVISAFNEDEVIAEKIESIYKSNYPADKYEVLIGSDASTDSTNEIVSSFVARYQSLHFYSFEDRRGKGNVVNELVNKTRGTILVLTDANVFFDRNTLFNLVRHFKNEDIGLVDTNMVNRGMKKEGISFQEKAYISREVRIKNMEGRLWGAMMGPFGGCYAIRKEDYTQVPSNYLVDDFYINMRIFERGKKAINDLNARVYEDVSNNLADEFGRKVRIATGNMQNLRTFYHLLLVKKVGFCFLSHKVLRWLGPFFIILAFVSNLYLAMFSNIYLVLFIIQLLLLLTPLFDRLLQQAGIHIKAIRLITHFYAMNLALLVGFCRSLKPVRSGTWERTRRNQ